MVVESKDIQLLSKIPDISDPDLYEEITPVDSHFVRLRDGEFFDVKMQYPLMGMENAIEECYVRQEVFDKLKTAQSLLPKGLKLRILDTWRPFALQEELYKKYSQSIIKTLKLEDADPETREKVIAKYVSMPQKNRSLPAVHTTGGAVDLTLIYDNGRKLDMGSDFDDMTPKSKTNYYEIHNENPTARDNRRILYNCMTKAGFTNLPSEWWHYDFGNRFWAYYKKTPAMYTGVFDSGEGIFDK